MSIPSRIAGLVWGFLLLAAGMIGAGIALAFVYRPERESVESQFRPLLDSTLWGSLAGFHYWGSAACIGIGLALLAWLFLAGFEGPSRRLWLPTLALVMLSLGSQIVGNALPMERHDVQTVAIEAGIAARTPTVGPQIAQTMLQGDRYSPATAVAWHRAKLGLSVLFILATAWAAWSMRSAKVEKPDVVAYALTLAPIVAALGATLLLPRAGGDLYRPEDLGAQTAAPGWYVLPLHALLRAFSAISPNVAWIGTALIPGIGTGALLLAPWWARRLSRGRRGGILVAAAALLAFLVGAFGTAPAPISGNQPVEDAVRAEGSAAPIDKDLAALGRRKFSETCAVCHGERGEGGPSAPSLQTVHQRYADAAWYLRFLRDPKSVRPGSTMPSFGHLPDADLRALAEWLRGPK